MRKVFLILHLIALFNSIVFTQDFSFYKENITMKIDEGHFYVSGIYYLKSKQGKSTTLLYPFPADSMYGEVDSVYIFNLTNDKTIQPIHKEKNKAIFKVDFENNSSLKLQISYRQKLLGNRAEYILESTISWNKPFQQANYQLIVPKNTEIISFSIPPKDSIATKKEMIYYWEKYNYMPEKNMIFEFFRKGN